MNGTEYGGIIRDVCVGIGALLAGLGVFIGMLALARALARLRATLDEVDRQLATVSAPVTSTLAHVDGVAKSLGDTAGTISRTADLTRSAVVPTIVNLGATLGGISAGLRRLFTGKDPND